MPGALHDTAAGGLHQTLLCQTQNSLPRVSTVGNKPAWAHGFGERAPKDRLTLGQGRELYGPGTSEYPSNEPPTALQCTVGNQLLSETL